MQLVEELKSLDDYLQDSKDYVGLNPPDFINAISTALELNNCPPLAGGPDRWRFPEIHGRAWFRAMDALARPEAKGSGFLRMARIEPHPPDRLPIPHPHR